ncbi:TetR/AcrR family transcriptional regulator [Glycomyces buryatensis]|uniref:TetR/AcrR family transcriptional regulator n=1 Tax=Glycomyces buryatensis TaxID=2570927 RepID=A0A4S8PX33_9ACTN|nr:TetR family transcriptional regulator [Glycomyces buryatensis]THV34625.1 TetR/AcrR family transcriptional regulator [Glycomyces buryatensis]
MSSAASDDGSSRLTKGERTRQRIIDVALELFAERGYDGTTMRAIAAEAGVSVGNAYYYFKSKEHLIQGFYEQATLQHAELAPTVLEGKETLAERIEAALLAWLEIAGPYHDFAGQFFRNAADPSSPLSPFSEDSAESRERDIALYREVLEGSKTRVPKDMAEILPEMLWLHQMVVVLYWVYDGSEGQEKSKELARRTAPLAARVVALSRLKILRPLVRQGEELVRDFLITRKPE